MQKKNGLMLSKKEIYLTKRGGKGKKKKKDLALLGDEINCFEARS